MIRFSPIRGIKKIRPSGINKNTIGSLYNAVGENSWCSSYVPRQIFYKLYLIEELRKLKCHLAGTIPTNRKNLPNPITRKNKILLLDTGNFDTAYWKGNMFVTYLTDRYNAGLTPVKRILLML